MESTTVTDVPVQHRRSARALPAAALLGSLLLQAAANAIPIGDFNWSEYSQDECAVGLCGAFFSVDNFSTDPGLSLGVLGDTFYGVSVNLQTDGGPLSLLLGDIAPGSSSQSIDDLFGAIISSAALTLTFGLPQLPGSIQFLDQAGGIVSALTGPGSVLIDYTAPITQVPESSTLLLVAVGLATLLGYRRLRSRGGGAAKSPRRVY